MSEEVKKDFLDIALGVFFSKDRIKLYALLLAIFGFILRFISAVNLDSSADDINHSLKALGIWETGKLTIWDQSNALYYYLMDASYSLFGTTQFGARVPALIFGTASIIMMFLLVKQISKSDRVALISAFLLAVSPWHIKNTIAEMDVTAMFFIMLGGFFLIRAVEADKTIIEKKNMIFAGAAIGLASLIKLYALFLAFSFFMYFLYMKRKNLKVHWKNLAIFTLIGFILLSPSIISEYLLYKDKGFTGIIPANTLGIGKEKAAEFYSWDASWGKKPDYLGFFTKTAHFDVNLPGGLLTLRYLLYADPIIFVLGFLGLVLSVKTARRYFIFFFIAFIPIWFYISSVIPLGKHLLFEVVLFIPMASIGLDKIINKLANERIKLGHVLILILVFQIIWIGFYDFVSPAHVYSKSSIGKFIEYKNENIPEDAFVIYDSRIYRGRANWMLQGKYYLEAGLLDQISPQLNELQSEPIPIKTFFVECARDDCGWGTIKDQQKLNQSMEEYVMLFSNFSESTFLIDQSINRFTLPFIEGKREEVFKVYSAQLLLKPEIFQASESTHSWYLYPLNYDSQIGEIFDNYETINFLDRLMDKFAHTIFYLALILTLLALVIIIYLFLLDSQLIKENSLT